MILHAGAQRLQTVTCNVTGRDLVSFFAELKQRVHDEVEFSADIYPEFTGAAVAQAQSREDLIVHSTLAGVAVLLLLSGSSWSAETSPTTTVLVKAPLLVGVTSNVTVATALLARPPRLHVTTPLA